MCGRFVASRPVEDIAAIFEVEDVDVPEELALPRWNVAPQAGVLAVRSRLRKATDEAPESLRRGLTDFRWGLVPSWAKDPSGGAKQINARAETLLERPAFRTALAKRRCVVPADAFYEWRRAGSVREPWCFSAPDGSLLAFAGLYEVWRPADPGRRDDGPGWHDEWLLTCSIITTDANEVVAPVHDRMPVILGRADWEAWLDPSRSEAGDLMAMLRPAGTGVLEGFPVSTAVNNARLEGPELIERIEPIDQPTLFG
ncbi:MAG TPA: SOS response-associated peptidase [Acidimicrobiales bacterium]|jgi:putative SOS response-associated peptidase YedK|nr:SOS response-associated peptidase [Acidimicrobiales bacterium]